MDQAIIGEAKDRESNVLVDPNGYLYVGVRFSLSKKAEAIGSKWCVYQRKWRILANHPSAPHLLSLGGYKQVGFIKEADYKDFRKAEHGS